jgi:oxygen-independent coproporphyrinogen-3 oxidase
MAGIYIHIPFCKKKCNYCNFYSVASSRHVEDFEIALLKEMDLRKNYLDGEQIETIYFGGGTPSLLTYDALMKIFEKLQQSFIISPDAEITLEANPDNLDIKKLRELRSSPVNRISIGIQSFSDDDLIYLNRIHNSSQAEASVKRSQDAGFENISIDLIYGIPTLTDEKWKENLEISFGLDVTHISAYGLTIEPKTALDTLIRKGKAKPADEEQSIRQYQMLMKEMKEHNFTHYEISNFCKEGFISKHNSNYWKGMKYLGLGPSAHSYDLNSRQWNAADLLAYLNDIMNGNISGDKEILSETDKFNEYIMTSLRTMWGCDLNYLEKYFGNELRIQVLTKAEKYLEKEQMTNNNSILQLTDNGKLFADGIATELFIDR